MIYVAIFLALFLVAIVWFVVQPVLIEVQTDARLIGIRQWPFFRFNVEVGDQIMYKLYIMGLSVPVSNKGAGGSGKKPEKRKTFWKKKSFRTWKDFIIGILNSFSLRHLIADVDSGDVVLNAQLMPVCLLATRGAVVVKTNFNGTVRIDLMAKFSIWKALAAFIKFLFKK